jgi:hypothetical protein
MDHSGATVPLVQDFAEAAAHLLAIQPAVALFPQRSDRALVMIRSLFQSIEARSRLTKPSCDRYVPKAVHRQTQNEQEQNAYDWGAAGGEHEFLTNRKNLVLRALLTARIDTCCRRRSAGLML